MVARRCSFLDAIYKKQEGFLVRSYKEAKYGNMVKKTKCFMQDIILHCSIRRKQDANEFSLYKEKLEDVLDLLSMYNYILSDIKFIRQTKQKIDVQLVSFEKNFFDFSIKELSKIISFIKKEFLGELVIEDQGKNNYLKNILFHTDAKAFILYPGEFSVIRSFANLHPIPMYRILNRYFDNKSFDQVRFLQNNYFDVLALWRRGDINEKEQHHQLTSIKSDLNKQGFSVRNKFEEFTKKNCFYYLFRYPNEKPISLCPICKKPWKLTEKYLNEFDYLCKKCRLIS
jgi:predicted  nucleic acid-binding Zn ribbon protein